MLARPAFSLHPPRLHASSCFPAKSFVSPTCKISFRNSFVSPTYAKTGGCTHPKNVGAPTFSLSFLPIPTLDSFSFQSLAHSFIFRITSIRCSSNIFRTLAPKTGGTPPPVRPIPRFTYEVRSCFFAVSCGLSTVDCQLPANSRTNSTLSCINIHLQDVLYSPQPR